jgi:hypothetical protein
MRHFKKWWVLYFFIACFVIGFVTMPFFHSDYFQKLWRSLTKIKWYYQILMFIGTLFLTLALHELAHFVTFLLSGCKNEMMIILFFVFYKKNGKWRLKIDFKLLLLGGGMVYPNFGEINTSEEFKRARKVMQRSLLAAPLFTLISGLLFSVITLIFFYTNIFLVPFSLFTLVFSLFYTYLSAKEAPGVYGDFKAYKRVKTDDLFALLIVSQYASTLPDQHVALMKEHLQDQNPISADLISKGFFTILLDMALQSDEIDYFVLDKVTYYANSLINYSRLINDIDNLDLAQAIIFYLDRLNYKDEANRLLNIFIITIEKSPLDLKSQEYYIKQTKHILKLSDESLFLNDHKNLNKGKLTFIMRNIPSFIESEQHKNAGYISIKPHLPIIHSSFVD